MARHPIHRISAIARPLEPNYPSNRIVLILAPIVALAVAGLDFFWRGAAPVEAGLSFLLAALTGFLSWALTREIAVDAEGAAFLALIAAPFTLLVGEPALLSLGALILLTRIVNRTVGPPALLSDCALALILTLAAMLVDGVWALGLAAVLAFIIDALADRPQVSSWGFAAAAGVMTAGAIILAAPAAGPPLEMRWAILAAGVAIGAALVTVTQPSPKSRADATDEALSHWRCAGAMAVALIGALAFLLNGQAGLIASLPIWAAVAAAVEGRISPRPKR